MLELLCPACGSERAGCVSGRQLKTSTSGFPTIMGDAAGDGGSGLPQMDNQEEIQVRFVESWSYSIVIVSSCCDCCWYGWSGVWKFVLVARRSKPGES